MKITYFGHSSFLVEAEDGTSIILDPYLSGSFDGAVKYEPITESADAVLASHDHDDHGATGTVRGEPLTAVFPTSEHIGPFEVTGVEVAHDGSKGSERGRNTIMVLEGEGIRLVHLGDLGHLLEADTVEAIGKVDVLMIPVGGFFTIDEKEAAKVVKALNPRLLIPMHYKTDKIDFPIAPVDGFLDTQKKAKNKVIEEDSSVMEVNRDTLPLECTTVVLQPSH